MTSETLNSCSSDCLASLFQDADNQRYLYLRVDTYTKTVSSHLQKPENSLGIILSQKNFTNNDIFDMFEDFLDKKQIRNLYTITE